MCWIACSFERKSNKFYFIFDLLIISYYSNYLFVDNINLIGQSLPIAFYASVYNYRVIMKTSKNYNL